MRSPPQPWFRTASGEPRPAPVSAPHLTSSSSRRLFKYPAWLHPFSLLSFLVLLALPCNMSKSLQNNKAIRMLQSAEDGGYGVVGVVAVFTPRDPIYKPITKTSAKVQPRNHNRRSPRSRTQALTRSNPPLSLVPPLLPPPHPPRARCLQHGFRPHRPPHGPRAI